MGSQPSREEIGAVLLGAMLATWWFGDALIAVALVVLWFVWKALIIPGMPPVLPLALSFQWTQAAGGLLYCEIFDRDLPTLHVPEHRLMVLLGLGCVVAITVGLMIGVRSVGIRHFVRDPSEGLTLRLLVLSYVGFTLGEGAITEVAWRFPALTQAILAVGLLRLAVLYLLFRRLTFPEMRVGALAALLSVELLLGFIGFFAGFREPVMIAVLVILERANRRAKDLVALGALTLVASVMGVLWMGVRSEFRADLTQDAAIAGSRSARFERMTELVQGWTRRGAPEIWYDADAAVDRIWAIYYPALALQRVPDLIPHTNGKFIGDALLHIVTPRILFRNKPELPSDSEKVRQYAGVWVAGREEATSIAFGYAAESYVDYGVGWMFAPVLLFGCAMGMAFGFLSQRIRIADFGVPLLTVVFWLSLYLFERSWAKLLGDTLTMFVYLGGVVLILERLLRSGRLQAYMTRQDDSVTRPQPAYRPPLPAPGSIQSPRPR